MKSKKARPGLSQGPHQSIANGKLAKDKPKENRNSVFIYTLESALSISGFGDLVRFNFFWKIK